MARPAFAGRRARSRSGQLAAFGAVVLLVSAALAVIGGAILPILDAGSRTLIAQSGPTASAERIEVRLDPDADTQDKSIRQTYATALRAEPADIIRTLTVDTQASIRDQPVLLQLTADPALPDAAELTAGAWPSAPDQIAIQDAAATELDVAPGDTVTLGTRALTVSGTWRAIDPGASRWFGDPAVASGAEDGALGPVLADESVLSDLPDTPLARWTMVPDPASLGIAGLAGWSDALARLDTEVGRLPGDPAVQLEGTLADTIARSTRVTTVAGGILGLPLVLVAVAGAIVLALIARAIASSRGGEFVLLRARGASLRALTGAAARESALTALIAAALGGGLAFAVLTFGLPAIGAQPNPPLALVIGIPIGTALLATILAVTVTVTELRAPVTGRAESGRAAVIASLGPLALALVAAGLALAQFLSLGSPVVVRNDGLVRTDPVALTAPVLVLLALALAAPAIAGPIVAVAERFARAGRGILPVLPLRQLARRTRSVAAGVLVIALAAGAVVLALGFQLGATASRVHAERAATGDDLRVSIPVRTSVEENAPGASSADLAGVTGVRHAFSVLDTIASVGADATPVVVADASQLARVRSAPPELARFTDALSADRSGVAIPDGVIELSATFHVSPDVSVPTGLQAQVVLWLADGDGAALRVPLGAIPLMEGTQQVSGQIPDTAKTVLAVQLSPPALPPVSNVYVTLDQLASPDGTAIELTGEKDGTLTSKGPVRFLSQAPGTDPLPVVVGAGLAERLGITTGSGFTFRVATVSSAVPAAVVGVIPSIPGHADAVGFVVDLPTLEALAVGLGGSVPAANQLWVASTDPDTAAAAIRTALTARAGIVSPRTFSPAPVLDPTIGLVLLGVGVTALLALLGFVAVAASISERRRTELRPLRSLGLSSARIRSARTIELAVSAVLAVLLGAAAGLLTASLVVPGLTGVLA